MANFFVTKEWFAFHKKIKKHPFYIIIKPRGQQPSPCGNVLTEEVVEWTDFIQQQNNLINVTTELSYEEQSQRQDRELARDHVTRDYRDDVAEPRGDRGEERRVTPLLRRADYGDDRNRDILRGHTEEQEEEYGADITGANDIQDVDIDIIGAEEGGGDIGEEAVVEEADPDQQHQSAPQDEQQGDHAQLVAQENLNNNNNENLVPMAPSNPRVTPAFNKKVLTQGKQQ